MGPEARNLILQLLNRNPMKRLGAGPRDSEDVKDHDFFKNVVWTDVIQRKLNVPPSKLRKVEPNPNLKHSFLVEEEKAEMELAAASN